MSCLGGLDISTDSKHKKETSNINWYDTTSNSLDVNGFNDAQPQSCPLHGNQPRHFIPIIFPPKSDSRITSNAAKKDYKNEE